MSNLYLSHETALAFWRYWSIRNALSLGAFHCRKAHSTEGLPFRVSPSSSVLAPLVETREGLLAILEEALSEDSDVLRHALAVAECPDASTSDGEGHRAIGNCICSARASQGFACKKVSSTTIALPHSLSGLF